MEIVLKLVKGMSYNGIISASVDKPFVTVNDEAIAKEAIASGYFKEISPPVKDNNESKASEDLSKLKVAELKKIAEKEGVDISKCVKKDEIIAAIKRARYAFEHHLTMNFNDLIGR